MKNLLFLLFFIPGLIIANNNDQVPPKKLKINEETTVIIVGRFIRVSPATIRCKGSKDECLVRESGMHTFSQTAMRIVDENDVVIFDNGGSNFSFEVITPD